MDTTLPFRHENESTFLAFFHPLTRLILPFIFVVPFLFMKDTFLIITLIFITFIITLLVRLNLKRIFSRVVTVLPLIILITIFLPLYEGSTVIYQIHLGITINIYQEGVSSAILLFLRIFGAIFIFMSFFSSFTYSEFIEALTKARVIPSIFVGSLVIMLHYIPILAESNKKILEAQELRGKKVITYWENLKAHAYIMGKSIIVNMERSERLYESLKMRGFSGKITFAPKKIKVWDVLIIGFFILLVSLFIYYINLQQFYMEVFKLFLP